MIKKPFNFYSLILLAGSIFSCIILYFTLQTFIGFFNLRFKNKSSNPITSSVEFDQQINRFPPISPASIPLKAYKAGFLLSEGKYNEGVKILKEASHVNPYIGFSEYILGNYYYSKGNIDSSLYYSKKAFDLWPKSIDNFTMLNKAYAHEGDTLSIIKSYMEIKDFFISRDEYYQNFIKYYSLAKFSYYDIDYNDQRDISKDDLIGEWVEVYNRKDGGVRVKINRRIEFLANGFFKSKNNFYLFDKIDSNILLRFQNNPDKVISTFTAKYSDEWQTLILNFNESGEEKDQFFKKVSDLNLPN